MTNLPTIRDTCVGATNAVDEPLEGTAFDADVVVLVELDRPWEAKPLSGPNLEEPLRAKLASIERELPRARLQLVRKPAGGVGLYVAIAFVSAERPSLLERFAASAEELLAIDFGALVREAGGQGFSARERPLHLVCTHGKRDACCARLGLALHRSLASIAPEDVLQTTHTGGHRFAPNVLVLPQGILYGRVPVEDAAPFVEAHAHGRFHDLEYVRGRVALAPAAQVAEVAALRTLGDVDVRLDAARVVDVRPAADGAWRVEVRLGGRRVEVSVAKERLHDERGAELVRPASCGDAPSAVDVFRAVDVRVLDGAGVA